MLAGQIGKPHGTGGEVYLVRISDDPNRFSVGAHLIHTDGRRLVVASARSHRDRFLVRFEGVETRSEAEGLRGELYVDPADLRDLGEDEFWSHDLEGCRVVDGKGVELGTITGVVENPAHDILVVSRADGEALVPAVKEIVVKVDLPTRTVTLDPPDGLFG